MSSRVFGGSQGTVAQLLSEETVAGRESGVCSKLLGSWNPDLSLTAGEPGRTGSAGLAHLYPR